MKKLSIGFLSVIIALGLSACNSSNTGSDAPLVFPPDDVSSESSSSSVSAGGSSSSSLTGSSSSSSESSTADNSTTENTGSSSSSSSGSSSGSSSTGSSSSSSSSRSSSSSSSASSSSSSSSTVQEITDGKSTVYFTSDISAEGMMAVYNALGWSPTGKVAVKLSTGERSHTSPWGGDQIAFTESMAEAGKAGQCSVLRGAHNACTISQ